jgi:hypothetical protein
MAWTAVVVFGVSYFRAYLSGRLREVETHCGETYSAYKLALKKSWHRIEETRKEQAALEECWRQHKGYNQAAEED